MLSSYTCVPSMWDCVKCGSSTTTQVWTFAWTSPGLLLYVIILTLVPYSIKWTKCLISVCVWVAVSLLTVYWQSANNTQGLWLPWSGRLLMVNSDDSNLIQCIINIRVEQGHAAWSAVCAAVLMILLLVSLQLRSAIYLTMELQTLSLFVL